MAHLISSLRAFLERELEPMAAVHEQQKPLPKQALPSNIADLPLKQWDRAVFSTELVNLNIVPPVNPVKVGQKAAAKSTVGSGWVEEGTYAGTQLALTEMYDRIERG